MNFNKHCKQINWIAFAMKTRLSIWGIVFSKVIPLEDVGSILIPCVNCVQHNRL